MKSIDDENLATPPRENPAPGRQWPAQNLESAVRSREALETLLVELLESKERYRILFDLGPVAVYSCDASGVITDFNRRAVELWGREPKPGDTDERWCGSFKLIRPDGVVMPHHECPMADVIAGRLPEARGMEVQIERPDGSRVTVSVHIRPLKNERGTLIGAINCFVDITERKQAEEALKEAHDQLESLVEQRTTALRKLSSKIIRLQDEERRRISRELHDSLGQYLAHAKMSVDALTKGGASQKDGAALSDVSNVLEKCLFETRNISYLLHPPLLDEVGFASAARWFVDGFAERSGIEVNLNVPKGLKRLPAPLELVLYRILQESLTNVHRHAQTHSVDIRLAQSNGDVVLEVKDHGKGMPIGLVDRLKTDGHGLGVGLNSMRERISDVGGRFEIQSDDKGTLIRVAVPSGHSKEAAAGED